MEGMGFDVGCRDAAMEVSTADEQRELLLGEGHKAAAYVNHEVFAAVSAGLPVGAAAAASEVWPGNRCLGPKQVLDGSPSVHDAV